MVAGRELARSLRCTKRRLAPLGSRGTGSIVHALPPEKGSAFGTARVQNYAHPGIYVIWNINPGLPFAGSVAFALFTDDRFAYCAHASC
jgi:hypothetical protein